MTTGFVIGGIASGLDTSSMIQQLMQIERQPILRIESRQAQLRKVDAAWGEVVTKVSAFRAALDTVRDADDWDAFLSASSSDEDAVRATATGGGDPGTLGFTVTSLAARHQVRSSGSVATTDTALTGTTVDVTVDGTTTSFALDGTTTLADLARQIDQAGLGVDAQVLKVADGDHRLVLTADAPGAAHTVSYTSDSQLGVETITRSGSDAQLTLADGLVVTRSSNTITDLLDGVTIELVATTTAPVEVTASRDTTAAADAVAELVTTANDLLELLNKHTAYNAESKTAGILQGDAAARSLSTQVRQVLSDTAGAGTITHGSQIGLSLTRSGGIELDRTDLESALSEDFEGVAAFMVDGYGAAIDEFLDTVEGSGGSIQRSRDAISGRIRSYDDQIEAFEARLALRETTLRRQFTGLETALAQLQSQGQWLAGQLGSLAGGAPM